MREDEDEEDAAEAAETVEQSESQVNKNSRENRVTRLAGPRPTNEQLEPGVEDEPLSEPPKLLEDNLRDQQASRIARTSRQHLTHKHTITYNNNNTAPTTQETRDTHTQTQTYTTQNINTPYIYSIEHLLTYRHNQQPETCGVSTQQYNINNEGKLEINKIAVSGRAGQPRDPPSGDGEIRNPQTTARNSKRGIRSHIAIERRKKERSEKETSQDQLTEKQNRVGKPKLKGKHIH